MYERRGSKKKADSLASGDSLPQVGVKKSGESPPQRENRKKLVSSYH